MNLFKLKPCDHTLLLGEGNFSFTVGLLEANSEGDNSDFGSIVTSCLESNFEDFSEEKKKNISCLEKKGAIVKFGVDVNNLEQHFVKDVDVFTKIIFNFPHVGGKMKINLNRCLLRNIFLNILSFVSDSTQILITLCDGQGGTEADSKKRRYNDTWQVVEMAARSNFVLRHVELFPLELFSCYSSVGYRGYDKGFYVENSLTHVFELGHPVNTCSSETDLIALFSLCPIVTKFGTLSCCKIYADLYALDLFNNPKSLFSFLFGKLLESLKADSELDVHLCSDELLPLHVPFTEGTVSFLDQSEVKLRSSLAQVLESSHDSLQYNFNESSLLLRGYCFKDLSESLEISPIEGQIVLVGSNSFDSVFKFLNSFKEFSKTNVDLTSEALTHKKQIFVNSVSSPSEKVLIAEECTVKCAKNDSVNACIIFCDLLLKHIFRIENWRELWSQNTSICFESLKISRPALYPLTFKFDVNFLIGVSFDLNEFFKLVWNLAHIAVANIEFISEFPSSKDVSKKFVCYRIFYQSFKHPLCRNVALKFHQNVVSKAISLILNAPIF